MIQKMIAQEGKKGERKRRKRRKERHDLEKGNVMKERNKEILTLESEENVQIEGQQLR